MKLLAAALFLATEALAHSGVTRIRIDGTELVSTIYFAWPTKDKIAIIRGTPESTLSW